MLTEIRLIINNFPRYLRYLIPIRELTRTEVQHLVKKSRGDQ